MLELGDQLFGLGLGLAELRVFQELEGLAHLFEDLFLARKFQGQPQPRGVLGLETPQRLRQPEHPVFQLVHLRRRVLLAESDRVAVGYGRVFAVA